ncbi:MAG TPA: NADH-quinone oxidoreductase subunit C [Acidimicrobiales bacterium]|nr:NADH-quinone oxidoreductase subunit C [Acidimicrobiales bacterium]
MSETPDEAVDDTEEAAPPEPPPERYGVPLTDSLGQEVLHPSREQYRGVVEALCEDGYITCIDVTAVDYVAHPHRPTAPGVAPERFEVVAQFLDLEQRRRVRLRVQVPADDPTIASIVDVYPGADALEREVFDMFGITFDGHPDLTRILMPEDWDGHPLRKDYAVGAIPVQFKGAGKEERS